MWKLENPNLPDIAASDTITGAPIACTDLGDSAAPIVVIDFQSTTQGLGVKELPFKNEITIVPEYSGNSFTVNVINKMASVKTVTSGGITFTSAIDDTFPQPGEFVFNTKEGTLTVYT